MFLIFDELLATKSKDSVSSLFSLLSLFLFSFHTRFVAGNSVVIKQCQKWHIKRQCLPPHPTPRPLPPHHPQTENGVAILRTSPTPNYNPNRAVDIHCKQRQTCQWTITLDSLRCWLVSIISSSLPLSNFNTIAVERWIS